MRLFRVTGNPPPAPTCPVVSRNSITTECAELQSVGRDVIGRIWIVLRVSGRPNFAGERDEADGGVLGWLDQPAARGRD